MKLTLTIKDLDLANLTTESLRELFSVYAQQIKCEPPISLRNPTTQVLFGSMHIKNQKTKKFIPAEVKIEK